MLGAVTKLGLGDCPVTVLNPPIKLKSDLLDKFYQGYDSLGFAPAGGSGADDGNTIVTRAPDGTTASPAATVSAGSAGNGSAPNATAPATVAVASGAVVLAVAASFL